MKNPNRPLYPPGWAGYGSGHSWNAVLPGQNLTLGPRTSPDQAAELAWTHWLEHNPEWATYLDGLEMSVAPDAIGSVDIDASVREDYRLAWTPTFAEFAELIRRAAADEFNCSHHAFGGWSFWRTGAPHAVIDASAPPYPLAMFEVHRCRFYLNSHPLGGDVRWADKAAVLAALNIFDWPETSNDAA